MTAFGFKINEEVAELFEKLCNSLIMLIFLSPHNA